MITTIFVQSFLLELIKLQASEHRKIYVNKHNNTPMPANHYTKHPITPIKTPSKNKSNRKGRV